MTDRQVPENGMSEAELARRCVLFADVCDSSRLYRELGDARARELVGAALSIARACVERHGGRVVDSIGDEVFCVLPDGDAGVVSAIEIHEAVAHERDGGGLAPTLAFRVGLVAGEVSLRGQQVYGDTVYLAKRVSTQAKYEQTLLDEPTFASLRAPDPTRFRSVGRLRLKGRIEPVELVEALFGIDLTTEVAGLPLEETASTPLELVLSCGEEELVVSAARPSITLGRGVVCDLVIPDSRVSRQHARVELTRGEFVWIDESRNGSIIEATGSAARRALRRQIVLRTPGTVRLGPDEDAPAITFAFREPTAGISPRTEERSSNSASPDRGAEEETGPGSRT